MSAVQQALGACDGELKNILSPNFAETEMRREKVSALQIAEVGQAEIAERLGISLATLEGDLVAIREARLEAASESCEDARAYELARLNEIERRLWAEVLVERPISLQGITSFLAIHDRRVRLLGLLGTLVAEPKNEPHRGSMPLRTREEDEALLDEIERIAELLALIPDKCQGILTETNELSSMSICPSQFEGWDMEAN